MKKSRYGAAFIILAALLFLFLVLNICIGSVNIPVSEIPKMLWGNGADETFTDIVMGIRFPRAMAAAILGGGLALSGYLLQTFFIIRSPDRLHWEFPPEQNWSWHLSW